MHNLDRTQLETQQDYEFEERPCKCNSGSSGRGSTVPTAGPATLGEFDEMELAAELLEVNDEGELDQFLGKLIRRVGKRLRRFVKTPLGGALVGVLKKAAVSAVPGLGPALAAAGAVGKLLRPRQTAEPPQEPAGGAAGNGGAGAGAGAEPTTENASEIFGLELEANTSGTYHNRALVLSTRAAFQGHELFRIVVRREYGLRRLQARDLQKPA